MFYCFLSELYNIEMCYSKDVCSVGGEGGDGGVWGGWRVMDG